MLAINFQFKLQSQPLEQPSINPFHLFLLSPWPAF